MKSTRHSRSFALVCLLLLCSLTVKPKPRIFKIHTTRFHSELKLNDDHSFTLSKSSCTYIFTSKGVWTQVGDTIMLTHEKVKWKRSSSGSTIELERSSKFLHVHPDTLYYLIDAENGVLPTQWLYLSTD